MVFKISNQPGDITHDGMESNIIQLQRDLELSPTGTIILKFKALFLNPQQSDFIPASSSEHRDLIAALTFQTGG